MKATLKVQLFDPFTDSRFVANGTTIDVQVAPLPARTPLAPVVEDALRATGGFRSYTVDSGGAGVLVTVRIRVSVPDALKPVATTAFEIQQDLLLTNDGTTVGMTPERSNSMKTTGVERAVHPRIHFGLGAPNQPPQINVDLTFIDLTTALRANGRKKSGSGNTDPFVSYDRNEGPDYEPNPNDIHYGCELHVLELTRGKPKTWLVVVPRAARAAGLSSLHALVFYRPAFVAYTDTGNIDLLAVDVLAAHLRDSLKCAPFFWWGCSAAPKWQFPNAGFEGQLDASGKAIILVIPLPHADVDTEGKTRATAARLRELLTSLLVALWSDGSIGADNDSAPSLGRLALLGLSAGGSGAYAALKNNGASVDELYLMDPSEHIAGNKKKLVKEWFLKGAKGNRKLRMVAGYGLSEMQTLRREIVADAPDRAGDLSISPPDASFFNTPGNFYHQAVIPRGASPSEEILDVPSNAGTSAVSKLSRETGVFLASPGGIAEPSNVATAGAKPVTRTGLVATPIELAGIVRANWLTLAAGKRKPAGSSEELSYLLSSSGIYALGKKLGDGHWIRHLWASAGGVGNPARFPNGRQDTEPPDGKVFEGHLLFCLKDGKFR
jgi:hypothetical protein